VHQPDDGCGRSWRNVVAIDLSTAADHLEPPMLINFFYTLRAAKLPVSVKEYLTLLEAMKAGVIDPSVDEFYYLARTTLVKDEAHFDKFDKAFAAYFKGVEMLPASSRSPAGMAEASPRARIQRRGEGRHREAMGWDELMETLKKRSKSRRSATKAATSGSAPAAPARSATAASTRRASASAARAGNRTAVKVWDQRAYKDYDDHLELGTRNIKVALRRLRASPAKAPKTNSTSTTPSTAPRANAGMLDIKMVPERHNKVKVLLLMDVGGTMDDHIHRVEELFSAAKTEFKHLEFYYFHNCVYDFMWKNNRRRFSEKLRPPGT
jgi:uncharacterized protein with von Willebrand factor type A (vWA) domain